MKQNVNVFKIESKAQGQKHPAKKRLYTPTISKSRRKPLEDSYYNDTKLNMTEMNITKVNMAGTNINFKSRNLEMTCTEYNFQRDNRFSVGMNSITGINVISPLRPNSRQAANRSNVYSVKNNYRKGRKLKDYNQLHIISKQPELSSQEQFEKLWSKKLIEDMIQKNNEDTRVEMKKVEDTKVKEESKIEKPSFSLDRYLQKLLEEKPQAGIKFMYFNAKKDSGNPYDLTITNFNERNRGSYYTISKKGITQYKNDCAIDFSSLGEWLIERDLYAQIKEITFFHHFRRWKILKAWRKGIYYVKRKYAIDELTDKLFYLDENYQKCILRHRKSMCQMEKLRFLDLTRHDDDITIPEFSKRQKKKQKLVTEKINEFSNNCKADFKDLIDKSLSRLRNHINTEEALDNKQNFESHIPIKQNIVFETLGFPSNLAYCHRAALRRECIRFLRLSYLIDSLAMRSLGEVYLGSVMEMQNMLEQLDANAKLEIAVAHEILHKTPATEPILQISLKFNPKKIPEEEITTVELKEFTPNISKAKEFNIKCHIQMKTEKDDKSVKKYVSYEVLNICSLWLEFHPGQLELENILSSWIDSGVKVISNFARWSKNKRLTPYAEVLEEWDEIVGETWDPVSSKYLNPMEYISDNPIFKLKDSRLHNVIQSAYNKAYNFLDIFKKYLHWSWLNDQADFSLLFNENIYKPIDTLLSVLNLLEYQRKKFAEKIPERCNLGILKINCNNARKALLPSPTNAMKKIEVKGSTIVKHTLANIKKWIKNSQDEILIRIVTVEDYVNQKNAWNRISDAYKGVKERLDICGNVYNTLTDFGLQVKKDDRAFYSECLQEITQLNRLIDSVADQQELNLDNIKKKIKEVLLPELQTKLQQLMQEVIDEKLLTKEYETHKVLDIIKKLEDNFTECEKLTEKHRNYQQTLNMDPIDFPLVEEIREGLELRSTLWKSLKDWQRLTEHWASQQFATINFQAIGPKAEQYAAIASRVDKELPENPISKELKVLVDTFGKAVPIVQDLTAKTLLKTHWDAIKKLLGCDFDITEPGFTLRSLLDLGAIKFQEEIHQIAVQASQEDALKKQLALIDEQWKGVILTIKPYKYKDTYVLDETEIILNTLDESLANINTILGSRYIKVLLVEAEGWRNLLLHLQALLDEWIMYQKRWIYLENIFSGQDIKKQLANEAARFEGVDKFFKKVMQRANKNPNPNKFIKSFGSNLLEHFKNHNKTLDEIEKMLEDYLETKRKAFPRFYFLSNDELLEILANQQQLDIIQQALRKCFDNLVRLNITENLDITAMFSSEGERVALHKQIKIKDNVEIWLDTLQTNMRETLSRAMKLGLHNYELTDRKDWVLKHYGQVVATISQIMWCLGTETSITDMPTYSNSLLEWYEENVEQIQQLTELVRGKLDPIKRKIIVALVTTDVHARDIIETLVLANVSRLTDFNWQKQLRYYWDEEDYIQKNQGCHIRQVAARLEYGCEYIGPSSRLVITPLTDRCWITITGALHIHLGAAPAGPAGTGKTESTKDLAKGLGIYCIVFNCSDQINYKMMARLFSGVVQQGAWTCLDEFNRINIEVLSVVARQMMDIRMALTRGVEFFNFEEKEIPIKANCGIFITMNPGYAGRTELPDNLKVHFRPVSMMIPDYELIAEIMLFAEGFSNAKALSKKMVKLYKLASEQLSQQDHYDFGMRAVKSVLVMAGALKRSEPLLSEDAVLLRAMRDSNVPKFVKEDLPLFHALIKDLFPTLEVEPVSYGELQNEINEVIKQKNYQDIPTFTKKVLQLYEVFTIRFGVMIVGLTGSGKTACFEILRDSIISLHNKQPDNEAYYHINLDILNPKAIDLGELYGEVNTSTQEWRDGLGSKLIRRAAEDTSKDRSWIVFDGPVDSLWIENMNTVLDDTMTLCLSNGQRIKLRNEMKMLFEVQDLAVASPATVSRCGMVYLAEDTVGWKPYVQTWLQTVFGDALLSEDLKNMLMNLFELSVDRGLVKIRGGLKEPIKTVDMQLVANVCNFVEVLLTEENFKGDGIAKKKVLQNIFVFSYIWGLAGSIDEISKDKV